MLIKYKNPNISAVTSQNSVEKVCHLSSLQMLYDIPSMSNVIAVCSSWRHSRMFDGYTCTLLNCQLFRNHLVSFSEKRSHPWDMATNTGHNGYIFSGQILQLTRPIIVIYTGSRCSGCNRKLANKSVTLLKHLSTTNIFLVLSKQAE